LKLFFPKLGKSAVITRKVSAPTKPVITPADDDVKAAIAEIAEHPEISLSRRDILRHHLEYVARLLADQLGTTIKFRADGNYELGELLPNTLNKIRELCGKAAEAAQSRGNLSARDAATELKAKLSSSNGAINVEQWAVNKADFKRF